MGRTALLGLPLLFSACASGDGPPGAVVTDSAGITIVANAAPDGRVAFVVDSTPVVSIGSLDGPPESTFEGVRDAAWLPDGGIVVADGSRLKFYDAAGRHVRTAGGEGEGPGEFTFLNAVVVCGGELLAGDMRQQRLSAFDLDGAFLRSDRLPMSGSFVFSLVLESCDEATGRPILRAPPPTGPGVGPERQAMTPVLRLAAGGEAVDTVARLPRTQPPDGVGSPFAAGTVYAFDGATSHVLHTDRLEVATYGPDGGLRRVVRIPHTPRPVSAEDNRRAIDARVERMHESFREPMRRQMEAAPVPSHMPAARALVADGAGRLWIQPFTPPWEDPASEWWVLDAEGVLLGTVTLPARFRPLEVEADRVLGVATDELDVAYVRAYGLRAPAR